MSMAGWWRVLFPHGFFSLHIESLVKAMPKMLRTGNGKPLTDWLMFNLVVSLEFQRLNLQLNKLWSSTKNF